MTQDDGTSVYHNFFTAESSSILPTGFKGGILSDEMGLVRSTFEFSRLSWFSWTFGLGQNPPDYRLDRLEFANDSDKRRCMQLGTNPDRLPGQCGRELGRSVQTPCSRVDEGSRPGLSRRRPIQAAVRLVLSGSFRDRARVISARIQIRWML